MMGTVLSTVHLGKGRKFLVVDADPETDAYDALAGSLLEFGGDIFRKKTSGSNTDVAKLASGGTTVVNIMKASDETAVNNTLQDDDELFFAVGAGEKWDVEIVLFWKEGTGGGSIKFTVDVPGGSPTVSRYKPSSINGTSSAVPFGTNTNEFGNASTEQGHVLNATIDNTGGAATTLKVRWAQFTTDASPTTMLRGSTLKAVKF